MRIWLIQDGEPLPGIDPGTRDWRCGILSRALAAHGHEVLWWASTFDHTRKKHRYDKSCTIEMTSGVKIRLIHGPGYRSNRSLKRLLHQRRIARSFAQESMDLPVPDILFCGMPSPELAEQAIIYGQKHHVLVVIDVRDQWPDIYLTMLPTSLRRFVRWALVAEFRRIEHIFRSASAILSVSDTYLDWALKYAGRPRRSADGVFALGYHGSDGILNESDTTSFRASYGIRPESLVVVFVGVFGFSYDLETVVHAAEVLQDRRESGIQIVLAGDGDSGPRLREMANGIPNLIFTGWLDQKSIQILLGLSLVGLAAYKTEATQTLPNKPFEYMAAGLPLLSSLPGELEGLIAEHQIGLNYRAGDVQSLIEKLIWLADHSAERAAMGQRARKLFEERFRADIIYPRLVTHLERIVADSAKSNSVASSK